MSRPICRFMEEDSEHSERARSRPIISSGETLFLASRSRSRICFVLSPEVLPVTVLMVRSFQSVMANMPPNPECVGKE